MCVSINKNGSINQLEQVKNHDLLQCIVVAFARISCKSGTWGKGIWDKVKATLLLWATIIYKFGAM
jgi:hypothetical protein